LIGTFVWKVIASGREGPGPRSRHGLAYDREAEATVLFGGIRWHRGGLLEDTWQLQDGYWSQVKLRNHPPPRHRCAMVYDSRRGECLLFGGETGGGISFGPLGDTWAYAGRRWRQCRTRSGPPPRCGHALAFDEEAGEAVLFGGTPGRHDPSLGDTWVFDGDSWHAVRGPAPPPRRYAAFAYDPDLGGCVLNGGSEDDDGVRGFGDTWLFRDRTWTRLARDLDTEVHDDHALAYHRAAKGLVMFGGLGGPHGVRVWGESGWRRVETGAIPPRHQCAPLTWDDCERGLVFHGGEARHGGPQFDTTWVLQLSGTAVRRARPRELSDSPAGPEQESGITSFLRRLLGGGW
jgi:hypothetical protein